MFNLVALLCGACIQNIPNYCLVALVEYYPEFSRKNSAYWRGRQALERAHSTGERCTGI